MVDGISICVTDTNSLDAMERAPVYVGQVAAQKSAVEAVAAVCDLQWSGQLTIECGIDIPAEAWIDEQEISAEVGQDLLAAQPPRLLTAITNAAPLAACGCHTVTLHAKCGITPVVDAATVAALGASFGSGLTTLRVQGCFPSPSFWAALPRHLPQLRHLHVDSLYCAVDHPSNVALAQLVAAHRGNPLKIALSVSMPNVAGLRALLGLPEGVIPEPADGKGWRTMVELQLPQL